MKPTLRPTFRYMPPMPYLFERVAHGRTCCSGGIGLSLIVKRKKLMAQNHIELILMKSSLSIVVVLLLVSCAVPNTYIYESKSTTVNINQVPDYYFNLIVCSPVYTNEREIGNIVATKYSLDLLLHNSRISPLEVGNLYSGFNVLGSWEDLDFDDFDPVVFDKNMLFSFIVPDSFLVKGMCIKNKDCSYYINSRIAFSNQLQIVCKEYEKGRFYSWYDNEGAIVLIP